jgi:hypothetical protein
MGNPEWKLKGKTLPTPVIDSEFLSPQEMVDTFFAAKQIGSVGLAYGMFKEWQSKHPQWNLHEYKAKIGHAGVHISNVYTGDVVYPSKELLEDTVEPLPGGDALKYAGTTVGHLGPGKLFLGGKEIGTVTNFSMEMSEKNVKDKVDALPENLKGQTYAALDLEVTPDELENLKKFSQLPYVLIKNPFSVAQDNEPLEKKVFATEQDKWAFIQQQTKNGWSASKNKNGELVLSYGAYYSNKQKVDPPKWSSDGKEPKWLAYDFGKGIGDIVEVAINPPSPDDHKPVQLSAKVVEPPPGWSKPKSVAEAVAMAKPVGMTPDDLKKYPKFAQQKFKKYKSHGEVLEEQAKAESEWAVKAAKTLGLIPKVGSEDPLEKTTKPKLFVDKIAQKEVWELTIVGAGMNGYKASITFDAMGMMFADLKNGPSAEYLQALFAAILKSFPEMTDAKDLADKLLEVLWAMHKKANQ